MTPLARDVLKQELARASKGGSTAFRDLLMRATCFEVSQILPLIEETAATISDLRDGGQLEHGGLLFAPASPCWIEASEAGSGKRLGMLITEAEGSAHLPFAVWVSSRDGAAAGALCRDDDGEHFAIETYAWPDGSAFITSERPQIAQLGMYCAASLIAINAPTGFDRELVPPHRGFVRQVRQAIGVAPKDDAYVVRLSKAQSASHAVVGHGGAGKAFHFCRAHVRQLPNGGTTRVRAHWRGDPTLGIQRRDYRVVL